MNHSLPCYIYLSYTYSVFHSFHGLMNSINWPASSVWVFIAQLGEHCSANAEATGSNPVEAPKIFFSGYFRNCLNCDSLRWSLLISKNIPQQLTISDFGTAILVSQIFFSNPLINFMSPLTKTKTAKFVRRIRFFLYFSETNYHLHLPFSGSCTCAYPLHAFETTLVSIGCYGYEI